MKQCKHPTCKDFCRREVKEVKRTPIARVAEKQKSVQARYLERSRAFRLIRPHCSIRSPVCTKLTQGVHHLKGKTGEELLMNELYWKSACNSCNTYIEDHDQWARNNGFKLSKFN